MTNRENNLVEYEAGGETVTLTPETVKRYMVSGDPSKVTNQEVYNFMALCQFQHLNPWLKDAYLIKYGDKSPASLVTSKEAYMKRAQAQPDYKRFEAGLILERDGEILEVEGAFKLPTDHLLGGWAKVYREGIEEPTTAKVSIQEYATGQSTWKSKPATMIRKVAIVQAMRETYPDQLGAMYVEEEARAMEPVQGKEVKKNKKPRQEAPQKAVPQTIPGMETPEPVEEVEPEKPSPEPAEEDEQGSFLGEDFEPLDLDDLEKDNGGK